MAAPFRLLMRASQTGVLMAGGKNLIGVEARCLSKIWHR